MPAAAISERNRESARDDAGWEGWLAKLDEPVRRRLLVVAMRREPHA